jgi:hypothetical protein
VKRFFLKLLVFMSLFVWLLLPIVLLMHVGELLPFEQIAAFQSNDQPTLYSSLYVPDAGYKLIATQHQQPQILALGTSRVMQIRAEFFDKAPHLFYNAGSGAQTIEDVRLFISQLAPKPRLLIVSFDQNWFLPRDIGDTTLNSGVYPVLPPPAMYQYFVQGWLNGELDVAQLWTRRDTRQNIPARGIRAILRGDGYRNDGSYYYATIINAHAPVEDRLAEVRRHIANEHIWFKSATTFDTAALAEVAELLAVCQQENIILFGFFPPYAPTIYAEMLASDKYAYIGKISQELAHLFTENGAHFFDFSAGNLPNTHDEHYIDGFHGSERVYLQLYIEMLAAQPDILGQYSNQAHLETALMQPQSNPFEVFGH